MSKLNGSPSRIFVSVDESTGRSTISFMPPDAGAPIVQEADHKAERAMQEAQSIVKRYPGASIHGPHFHAARPVGRTKRVFRKPAAPGGDE
jgi:hypothetical protein